MAISNEPSRRLPYPLFDTLQPIGNNIPTSETITQIEWPDVPNDELVNVIVSLSLDEYVALASTVDVGRDIAYGEDSELIWWLWNRIWQAMDICTQVEDCIETNVAVQTAIANTIINNEITGGNQVNPDTTLGSEKIPSPETTPIAPAPPACDKDALWAGIREMVERIDGNGRDVLEDLQFTNDKIEQWGEIIDLVPLLGDTIKDISDLFTAQIPDMLNAYNSASSPTFLDNVACDLFEMVCDECRYPTFDEIVSYFGSNTPFSFPDFANLTYRVGWDFIKTISSAVPEPLWYTVNVWQCITLAFNGAFKRSYGEKSFEIWASFGEDNPNDNWEILCDGCEDVNCIEYDFTVSDHGFTVWTTGGRPFGQWVSGEGWKCTWNSVAGPGFDNRVYIEKINMALPFDSTDFEMDYLSQNGGVDRGATVRLTIGTANQFGTSLQPDPYPDAPVSTQIATIHEDNGDGIRINVATDTTSSNPDAFVIQKLRVFYLAGQAPEGGSPC